MSLERRMECIEVWEEGGGVYGGEVPGDGGE